MEFVHRMAENIVEKGKRWLPAFSLFPTIFFEGHFPTIFLKKAAMIYENTLVKIHKVLLHNPKF